MLLRISSVDPAQQSKILVSYPEAGPDFARARIADDVSKPFGGLSI